MFIGIGWENERRAYIELSRIISNIYTKEKDNVSPSTLHERSDIKIPRREGEGGQFEFDL